jgi:hypothetical protein
MPEYDRLKYRLQPLIIAIIALDFCFQCRQVFLLGLSARFYDIMESISMAVFNALLVRLLKLGNGNDVQIEKRLVGVIISVCSLQLLSWIGSKWMLEMWLPSVIYVAIRGRNNSAGTIEKYSWIVFTVLLWFVDIGLRLKFHYQMDLMNVLADVLIWCSEFTLLSTVIRRDLRYVLQGILQFR